MNAPATSAPAERIAALEAERRGAARRFCDLLAELEHPLAIMVAADAELNAALYAAGQAPAPGPDVRSLAAEALLGAAAALRPHIAFATAESARRCAEELRAR